MPRLAQDTPCLRVAKEYAPSHVVSGSLQQNAYIAERSAGGSTDFIVWNGNDCGNVDGGNASLMWIHLDD
ncbi:hypothetical protein [Limosilactobacillus mucosae]|uniref:hypothetical protein n=1 Tax=Limosilactobacillus mucosae TaxID=97478 RepID=UPI0022E19B46|nr:hypothetical protein [Limosilactobacillus mucosae]